LLIERNELWALIAVEWSWVTTSSWQYGWGRDVIFADTIGQQKDILAATRLLKKLNVLVSFILCLVARRRRHMREEITIEGLDPRFCESRWPSAHVENAFNLSRGLQVL
jgi:hypothetical protein